MDTLLDDFRRKIQQKLAMEGDSVEVRELETELRKLVRVFSASRKIVGVLQNYEKDLEATDSES